MRKLRDAHRDRPLLRLLHRRERRPAVLRDPLRADGRLAVAARPGGEPGGDRAPDARLHGHHARLAGPSPGNATRGVIRPPRNTYGTRSASTPKLSGFHG